MTRHQGTCPDSAKWKSSARWPKTKFVLASGFPDEPTTALIEQCNATILAKPYDMQAASEAVMRKLAAA